MYNLFSGLIFCPCFYMKRSHSVQCCLIWRRKTSWLCWNTLSKSSKEEEDSHICILLATSLNNLIPIRSACVVGLGGGRWGRKIYREISLQVGFLSFCVFLAFIMHVLIWIWVLLPSGHYCKEIFIFSEWHGLHSSWNSLIAPQVFFPLFGMKSEDT